MEEYIAMKDSPIWNQGFTKGMYRFPLPTDRDFFEVGVRLGFGNPDGQNYRIGPFWADKSPKSHMSPFKWAIDFLVPDGTEILAADSGHIIEVVENFNEGGDSEDFISKLNYLTIKHHNGEYSQYCHLEQYSVSKRALSVGSYVKKGQQIATVGKTGWTDRDHLHFIVLRFDQLEGNPWPFYSLEVQFEK